MDFRYDSVLYTDINVDRTTMRYSRAEGSASDNDWVGVCVQYSLNSDSLRVKSDMYTVFAAQECVAYPLFLVVYKTGGLPSRLG